MNPARHASIQHLRLGVRHEKLELDSSDEVRLACHRLITQARRELVLMTRHLDPVLFDNIEMADAMREFVLRSRAARVRILVKDPQPAVHGNHRFIELAQRLSSFVEIRVPAREFHDHNSAFLVADKIGAVHRSLADRYEATVNFFDQRMAGELAREFSAMWESALPSSSMRRLHL